MSDDAPDWLQKELMAPANEVTLEGEAIEVTEGVSADVDD